MKMREVKKMVRGRYAIDGAGVHLVRVLDNTTVGDFDPFLMLDAFDSVNPNDYTAGFPFHPHRGIETFTYLAEGEIEHHDSLGNKGTIRGGQAQWMTAGSGVMHQEMPKASSRMLGLQLWVNLPKKEKMVMPAYNSILEDNVPVAKLPGATVRVVAGEYSDGKETLTGFQSKYIRTTCYDVSIDSGKDVVLKTQPDDTVFVFLLEGDAVIDGQTVAEKTAVLFDKGDAVRIAATSEGCRFVFYAGKPLNEPVSWGGPIVMNTRDELDDAFDELRQGTFVRH